MGAAGALIALTGCTNWVARRGGLAPAPAASDHVRLCVGSECREYHGVRLVGDTVYATPYFQSTKCDSCVQRFPFAAVRRVDVREPNLNGYIVALLVITPLVVLIAGMSSIGGPGS